MAWWSCEYLPRLWDSGDEATGPQIVETTLAGRSSRARTLMGAGILSAFDRSRAGTSWSRIPPNI